MLCNCKMGFSLNNMLERVCKNDSMQVITEKSDLNVSQLGLFKKKHFPYISSLVFTHPNSTFNILKNTKKIFKNIGYYMRNHEFKVRPTMKNMFYLQS